MTAAAPSLLSTRPVLSPAAPDSSASTSPTGWHAKAIASSIFDSLARPGVEDNLEWLMSSHGNEIRSLVAT